MEKKMAILSASDKFKLIRLIEHLYKNDKLYFDYFVFGHGYLFVIGTRRIYFNLCLNKETNKINWNKISKGLIVFFKSNLEDFGYVNFSLSHANFKYSDNIVGKYMLRKPLERVEVDIIILEIKNYNYINLNNNSITEYIKYNYEED